MKFKPRRVVCSICENEDFKVTRYEDGYYIDCAKCSETLMDVDITSKGLETDGECGGLLIK